VSFQPTGELFTGLNDTYLNSLGINEITHTIKRADSLTHKKPAGSPDGPYGPKISDSFLAF
jgi:hypothetical protein